MEILTVDYTKSDAGVDFVRSLHETGFAVIKNSNVDYNLVKNIFSEWQNFFNSDAKTKYPYNKTNGDGYVGIDLSEIAKGSQLADIKEFYQIYRPWGRYPEEVSSNALIYFDQIFNFAKDLIAWLDNYTPELVRNQFSERLLDMVSLERTMLRILHYPPIADCENIHAIRAAAHEDINLITLLPASNATGLQVKTKEDKWLDVGTNEGEIIINVGDMLQECSNKFYVSTTHRVANPDANNASRARFSMPIFVHPRADVFLSNKYNTAEQYLDERLVEIGLRD